MMVSDPTMMLNFKSDRTEVANSGELAFTQGTYNLTFTDPVSKQLIKDHGGYGICYRKQSDGSWKAVSDVVTSFTLPGAPAPKQ